MPRVEIVRKADGEKLYVLRKRAWLSQRKLAEIAGISEKTVVDIELGHTKTPRERTLLKLAKALECYPDDLLEASEASLVEQKLKTIPPTRIGGAAWDARDLGDFRSIARDSRIGVSDLAQPHVVNPEDHAHPIDTLGQD
jgi:transcriptional regulator with XRE-family HTH domain